MQIENNLPQFKNLPGLILTTGLHEGKLYLADSGNIEVLGRIRVPDPAYTDREGLFARALRGRFLGRGSVYENKKNYVRVKFIKQAKRELEDAVKKFPDAGVYIFVPGYLKQPLLDALKKNLKDKIRLSVEGNYSQEHPFELLSKIKAEKESNARENPLEKPEALKLRKRPGPIR